MNNRFTLIFLFLSGLLLLVIGSAMRRGVDRDSTGEWGEPRNLGASVNTEAAEIYSTLSSNGNLYFSSDRDGESFLSSRDGSTASTVSLNGWSWAASRKVAAATRRSRRMRAFSSSAMNARPAMAVQISTLASTATAPGQHRATSASRSTRRSPILPPP